MLGALVPIDAPYEVISPGASAVQPASGGALSGGNAKQMSPMESMKAIFEDIRDGIENIAGMVQTLVLGQQPTVGDKIAASDTDTGVTDVPEEKKGMLDSLRDSVGEDEFGKLKKALFVGIVASLFMFGEQIKPVVAGFLKALKMVIDFIGPKGALFLAIVGISKLMFPKTFALVLKTAVGAIKFLAAGFSSLSSGLSAVLVPLAPVIAIVAGIAAVIYSLKEGFDAFQESLEAGDSMIDAIIAGVSTALATLISLPSILFTKLVGFVAGLLGFDNVKEKLMNIDFVGAVTDGIKFMLTKAKDFVMSIFDIDFKGILGKGLDILGAIMTRIKAIAAAGFAAVKAAFPGGESPGEAFDRVYQERIAKAEESEPVVDEGMPSPERYQQEMDQQESFDKLRARAYELYPFLENQENASGMSAAEFNKQQQELYGKVILKAQDPDVGKEIIKGSIERTSKQGTVVTTINNTDASNTNNSTSNTTNTGDLAVDGTDTTAKYLAAAYGR